MTLANILLYEEGMLRDTPSGRTKKVVRFPGIVRHAEKLGVSRIHLFLVLTGKRQSKKLRREYRELKREEAAAK